MNFNIHSAVRDLNKKNGFRDQMHESHEAKTIELIHTIYVFARVLFMYRH